MTNGFRRGSTVAYGPHWGIVWLACKPAVDGSGGLVEVLPLIVKPRRSVATDVPLSMGELCAAGIELAGAVVRVSSPKMHAAASLRLVGELRGKALCRMVNGVVRAVDEARAHARWTSCVRHKLDNAADAPQVKMVGD